MDESEAPDVATNQTGSRRKDATARAAVDESVNFLLPDPPPPPRTRGECVDGPRPCPHWRCKHHLFLSLVRDSRNGAGGWRADFANGTADIASMEATCALDVADLQARGAEISVERIAELLGIPKTQAVDDCTFAFEKLRRQLTGAELSLWTKYGRGK